MYPSCCAAEPYAATFTLPRLYNWRDSALESLEETQYMIERLQRTLFLQEHRITELERQLGSRRENMTGFPFFSPLPPELRCRIWELALPVKIFRPFRYFQPSFLEWTSTAPPAISRVCREARYVAHKNGALYCHEFLAPFSWTWFNGHRDILDLSPYHIVEDGFISVQRSLLRETRAIMLDVNFIDSRLITGLFGEGSCFPNIRTIYLMAGNTFQAERQYWHPHAVARLFGSQLFAHVDIEDDGEVKRLEQLLTEMTSASDGSFVDKWHRDAINRLQAQIRPSTTLMNSWKEAKRLIMQGWVSYNVSLDISKSYIEGGGVIKEDKVRKSCPRMPVIKLVQTFELSPVSKLSKQYKDHGRQVIEDLRG